MTALPNRELVATVNSYLELTVGSSSGEKPTVRRTLTVATHLPVSPETQTWGAIASVATGIGTVLSGVGNLRNE
jgi:hypothetical protein